MAKIIGAMLERQRQSYINAAFGELFRTPQRKVSVEQSIVQAIDAYPEMEPYDVLGMASEVAIAVALMKTRRCNPLRRAQSEGILNAARLGLSITNFAIGSLGTIYTEQAQTPQRD